MLFNRHAHQWATRVLRPALALAVTALSMVFVMSPQAFAVPAIQLTKSAPADVLVGGEATYRLTANNSSTNPTAVIEYNLSFRDVLPVGVTYVVGSTSPASLGEPSVFTNATTGQQTVVWTNVSDLAVNADLQLTFKGKFSGTALPVGSSVVNNANLYAHSNPRFVPRFDSAGQVVAGSYTETASATSGQTVVTAIKVTKSEPSPEAELMRGVHDHTTVYTLQVTNNTRAATNAVSVTDFVPAGLEFLGCGQVDNSGSTREYPGAASLVATPAVGAACLTPDSVATVLNPAGYPAGTYTRVIWTLGNMAVGEVRTIKYAAGIPQRSNTTTWPSGTPTPASLTQGSNLNNNSGPSTREGASEQGLTNYVRAEGDYTGPLTGSAVAHVISTETHVVTAEDLAMQKSTSSGGFASGGVATFSFTLEAGEYADAGDIVIVDHLPNGMCPLDDQANYVAGTPAECNADAGNAPTGAQISDVVQNADGTFDVTFTPVAVPSNGIVTITFKARMRTSYTGGTLGGEPTSAGDQFTNNVSLQGTTTMRSDVNAPAPDESVEVEDASSSSVSSAGPTLTKTIKPNETPMSCATGPYLKTPTPAQVTFSEGSRACFQIRLDLPSTVWTRDAVITDFLPVGVTYEAGSATLTPANNVTAVLDDSTGVPTWTLGDPQGAGRFAQPGGVFEVRLAGTVGQPAPGPLPDLTANLAKLRYSDGSGGTVSLRDLIDIQVAPAPPVSILKGVADVDGLPIAGNPVNTDGSQVQAGSVVSFRLDVSNGGSAANGNNIDIQAPDVWDVLPVGIRCVDISVISPGGVCTNPGAGGHPSFTNNATLSAIRWQQPATYLISAGATRQLTYDMTIPATVGVSTVFTNTAAVASYDTLNNIVGETAEHLPKANIDTTTNSASWDVPPAQDTSNVHTPDPTLAKSATTAITDTNNNAAQAVVGEGVTYKVSLRVPAKTSVFNGALVDPMPTGLTFLSATAGFSGTNTSPAIGGLPAGVTFTPATGALSLGATYVNNTTSIQLFEVTIQARVSTLAGNTHGVARTNTASFNSSTATAGGTALPRIDATSPVTVIAPSPVLTKTDNDADNIVVAGQTITYTLTAGNASGRPVMHDSWVVDCLPTGLAFGAFVTPFPGTATAVAGNGSNGCAVGETALAWNVGDVTTTNQLLSYTATTSPASAGRTTYRNTATLTGSSLQDGKAGPQAADNPVERVLLTSVFDTMTVQGATVTKSANPTARTIGQSGSWTVTAAIPADVNFYDSALIDELPAGVDPATVTSTPVTCTYPGGASCVLPGGGVVLTQAAGPLTATRIGWRLGDLGADTQVRTIAVTYTSVVRDLASLHRSDTLVNLARVSWNAADGTDPVSAGATFNQSSLNAPATITVLEPVLSIDKTVNDTTPAPGDVVTYSVLVSNLVGPNTSAAYNATVVDQVPIGVVVDASSIAGGGLLTGAGINGGGTISWTVAGPIAPGSIRTFTYAAQLADSLSLDGSALTNTADITGYSSLSSGGRQYVAPLDTATAIVTPDFPHVSVAKSVNGTRAYIGEPKTWTVTITSDGASKAFGVDATDTLPVNWAYDVGTATASVSGGPATPVAPQLGTTGGRQTLTWTNLGDLPLTRTIVITYSATPTGGVVIDAGVGSSIAHSNTVTTKASDATGAESSGAGAYAGAPASATARIDSADVTIAKAHTGTPVAGRPFGWTIRVANDGTDTARGPFTVTDDLPSGVLSPVATGLGWSCGTSTSQVTCVRTDVTDTLAPAASFSDISVSVDIPSDIPDGSDLTNDAGVTAHTYDPDTDNNQVADAATVTTAVDLVLDKQLSGDLVAGNEATYTLAVQNDGPSDGTGPVVVTDTLPVGVDFVSADGTGWSCSESAGTVTCTKITGLTNGEVAPVITVVVDIPADRQSVVINAANVDGPDVDPVPANNDDSVSTDPIETADLSIEKESRGPFIPGSTGTYRFSVHNFGPSYADVPVRITDTLPAELTYAGTNSVTGVWSCNAVGQDVTCDLTGRLANNADAVVEFDVDIDADHTGGTHNDAEVTSGTPDPNPLNDTDDDDTNNNVHSDLVIDKSHVGSVVAGTDVTYTLAVSNAGPSTSSGPIVVTDLLPDGMTFGSANGTGWTCTNSDQTITCTRNAGLSTLAPAPDLTVVASVASNAGPAILTNVASVDGPETDPTPANNTDLDDTTIDDRANISLTKTTVGDNPVRAGGMTTFEIIVRNDGPSDADNVSVTDALPAGTTLVSAAGPGWTCGLSSPVVCDRNTLVESDSATITVIVRVGTGVADGTTLTNTADSSTTTPGDVLADNTDDADVDVIARADLEIQKTHVGTVINSGTQVTFELRVGNAGLSDAQAPLDVTDELPVGMTYAGSSGPWTCTPGVAGPSGQQVTCRLMGSDPLLAYTNAPMLNITAQVDAAADAGTLTNSGTVSSGTVDPTTGNNTDTDDVEVDTLADVSIVKTHGALGHIGDTLDFTLLVSNDGPSEARAVVVSDQLPSGLTYVDAAGQGWTCSAVAELATCALNGPLASGASALPITVTANVTPAAYPAVDNTADVTSGTTDSDASNNTSTDSVDVPAQVDLSVVKHHRDPLKVGESATYELTVKNAGPTPDAGPVSVIDTLPTGLTFVSASGAGWTCEAAGQKVTCVDVDGLEIGERSKIAIVVDVEASAYPQVINTAGVTSDSEDLDPSNNATSDPSNIMPSVELTVTKELLSITPNQATYEITVTNLGPNDTVTEVLVVDQLPTPLDYKSAHSPGWSCANIGKTVRCTHARTLAVGESSGFVVVAEVHAAEGTTITNTAVVSAGDTDGPDPQDTATTVSPKEQIDPPDDQGSGWLPGTGGISLWWLLGGLAMLVSGAGVLHLQRRR